MKLMKLGILGLIISTFAMITACQTYSNTLSGTQWETLTGADPINHVDTTARYEFVGTNGGRYFLKTTKSDILVGTENDSIGYSYNERTGAIMVQRNNKTYDGTVDGSTMTLVWNTYGMDSIPFNGEIIPYYPDTIVYTKVWQ